MPRHPVVLLATLAATLALYFLPALIADRRGRRDLLTIALFNAVLGWTVLGWLLALSWALQINPPNDLAAGINERRRHLRMLSFSRHLLNHVHERQTRGANHERPSD